MVDSLISIAVEKLTEVLTEQVELFAGATEELEKLRNTFQSIQALLTDARRRRISEHSVQLWLDRLGDVSREIDTVLTDHLASASRRKDKRKVCWCLSFVYDRSDRIVSRYKMARQIKEIREKLDQIVEDKDRYLFNMGSSGGEKTGVCSRPHTSSLLDESEIIIMDDDKEAVIRMLVDGISSSGDHHHGHDAHVIAIVGSEESGKTNLAKQIYHDGRVRDYFNHNCLYWVCVTDVFDVTRLTKTILEQVEQASISLSELNSLQQKLVGSLRGKKFLLVLDDVWNEDDEKWKRLRVCFKSGAEGSKILVTTRTEKVANTMNAAYIHKLKGLS
ncbi:hypothetical protein ACLOJK_033983 [Asimina triloba]